MRETETERHIQRELETETETDRNRDRQTETETETDPGSWGVSTCDWQRETSNVGVLRPHTNLPKSTSMTFVDYDFGNDQDR